MLLTQRKYSLDFFLNPCVWNTRGTLSSFCLQVFPFLSSSIAFLLPLSAHLSQPSHFLFMVSLCSSMPLRHSPRSTKVLEKCFILIFILSKVLLHNLGWSQPHNIAYAILEWITFLHSAFRDTSHHSRL